MTPQGWPFETLKYASQLQLSWSADTGNLNWVKSISTNINRDDSVHDFLIQHLTHSLTPSFFDFLLRSSQRRFITKLRTYVPSVPSAESRTIAILWMMIFKTVITISGNIDMFSNWWKRMRKILNTIYVVQRVGTTSWMCPWDQVLNYKT